MAAWYAIVVALDSAGDHPQMFDGPGLTVDEFFNASQGVALVDRLLAGDVSGFCRVDARLPDHPPLGRVAIGFCHELAFLASPPVDRIAAYSVTCARTGSATAFAALVLLVGATAGRWYGRWGGAAAALAVVFMPRLFGHAHLAALETMVNLTITAAILFLAERWGATDSLDRAGRLPQPPRGLGSGGRALVTAALGGVLFGLALLTKVQAILLPIPVALWAFWQMRLRAAPLIAIWGLTGLAVFFAFWPYLWSAPFDHFQQYLGRTTRRDALYVWYFGEALADRDVPWHYPWVMFLSTVPVGLHVLGVWGVCALPRRVKNAPREILVLACIAFPLCVFSVPGVPVYDGERLFSFVFPPWAVLIGRGAENARKWLAARRSPRFAGWSLWLLMVAQGTGLVTMAPCWLSYYNLAVGGLRGAAKLGLEISYWGDGVTRSLLAEAADRAAAGETIAVMPVLYDGQWDELLRQSPILRRRDLKLAPFDADDPAPSRYVLLFVRPEYLPERFRSVPKGWHVAAAVRRDGVAVALLLERP